MGFLGLFFLFICFCTQIDLLRTLNSEGDAEVAVPTDKLLILLAASPENDGFLRFMQSANYYNYSVEVLGGEGGGAGQPPGNGWRSRVLKQKMSMLSKQDGLVVMILDSNDIILAGGPEDCLKKFRKINHKVVVAAEWQVWLNEHPVEGFPVTFNRKRPLGPLGGMMGYAPDISELLESWDPLENTETRTYLDPLLRERFNVATDDRCEIFQTLSEELGEVLLKFGPEEMRVRNAIYDTLPVVIQGNGNTRVNLNYLGNYIPNIWTYKNGCRVCNQDMLDLSSFKECPRVTLGVFVERPTPFLPEFLNRLLALDYPKDRLSVFIYNKEAYHEKHIQRFWMENGKVFQSFEVMGPGKQLTSAEARDMGMDLCRRNTECSYYFSVDADVMLTNNRTLRLLIEQNRKIIAPLVHHRGKMSSNFWGALSADGYFARSEDYLDIVRGRRVGVWNAPYVAHIYLIKGETLRAELGNGSSFALERMDPDMALCRKVRELGIFMYVTNRHEFGRLISTVNYKTSHYNGDLWQIFENPADWKEKYIHPDYSRIFTEDIIEQPCLDVFRFPILSAKACDELVGEAENLGKWSAVPNWDKRLTAAHEPLLASDIHMAQMNFEKEWLFFIREFISPVIAKVFFGYSTKSYSVVNFIAKHSAEGLASQKTRHDKSTLTMSIALNNAGVDFQGGGCKFHRYNCSIESPKKGWSLMHPGPLTHLYKGLPIARGMQYIAMSFIDP